MFAQCLNKIHLALPEFSQKNSETILYSLVRLPLGSSSIKANHILFILVPERPKLKSILAAEITKSSPNFSKGLPCNYQEDPTLLSISGLMRIGVFNMEGLMTFS